MMKMFLMVLVMMLTGCQSVETPIVEEVEHNYYAQTTVVVELDRENDEVICVDFNGEEWVFIGIEDWMVGDYASMVMDDMGTELIFDDEIVSVRYDGWLDGNFGYDFESGLEVVSMTH